MLRECDILFAFRSFHFGKERRVRRKKYRISYIRRPLASRSIPATCFAVVALASTIVSLVLSVRAQGNGEANVSAWGFCGIAFTVMTLIYGITAFREKEKNYILAKIASIAGAILAVFWVCMLIVGILSLTM